MKLITLAIVAAVFSAGAIYRMSSDPAPVKPDSWTLWKMKFGRTYGTDTEESMRKSIFHVNEETVTKHNAEKLSWTLELNKFADMTEKEIHLNYTGLRKGGKRRAMPTRIPIEDLEVNGKTKKHFNGQSKDWRDDGAVNDVKDQGQCGSCWAFSAIGALESFWKIQGNSLQTFSEQQLVDCAGGSWGNQGCNGGLQEEAYDYLKAKGAMHEDDYPYVGKDKSCKFKANKVKANISDYKVLEKKVSALQAAIDQWPVACSVEADQNKFQFYSSGVVTKNCGTQLDHGVTCIGYGEEGGDEYFLVRNSWGSTWGDNGYIKIGVNNVCGILDDNSWPTA